MRYAPAILVGRFVRFAARLRKPGGGSAIPGLIVNKIAPGYLTRTLSGFPQGLVVVSGSSGKSTTTKMLVAILRAHGVDVFTNPSTANISQGLTSALLERADWRGRVPGEVAVLEMDEGHGAAGHAGRRCPRRHPHERDGRPDRPIPRLRHGRRHARPHRGASPRGRRRERRRRLPRTVGRAAATRRRGITASAFRRRCSTPRREASATPRRRSNGWPTARASASPTVNGAEAVLDDGGTSVSIGLPARGTHYAVDAAAAYSTARAVLGERFSVDHRITCAQRDPGRLRARRAGDRQGPRGRVRARAESGELPAQRRLDRAGHRADPLRDRFRRARPVVLLARPMPRRSAASRS